ncbi:hypothetical protein [Flavobacterium sp.]|uniref:5'-methylthioadenosine/S-adenosylhomocysteine nucleosidase family protein n=1 Tax=Flavobacterium sp. TaxID=239 RepID=UPI0039E39838
MASSNTKIRRSITEFKNFLDYYQTDYDSLYRSIKPGEGWKIPYFENELYVLVENMHGQLYEGIYPKLTESHPATDTEIISSFRGSFDYLELAEKLLINPLFEAHKDSIIGLAETLIYDLFLKAKEKLSEVIELATKDLDAEKPEPLTFGDKFGIIVATQTEFDAVINLLKEKKDEGYDPQDSNVYYSGYFEKDDKRIPIVVTKTHHQGLPAASTTTTKLILKYRPKFIFMIGHQAGNPALQRTHKLGHILICDECVDYQQTEIIQRKGDEEVIEEKDRKISILIDSWLKTRLNLFSQIQVTLNDIKSKHANNAAFPDELKAYSGKTVSGSALLRSATRFEEIAQKNPGLIGLDMETYGFYYACTNTLTENQPKFASIKSISDYAEHVPNYSPECKAPIVRQEYACHTSANFLHEFLLDNF